MTGIEKSLQLSAANHYTMFLIYPSSARQTIIAQKGRGFVLSLCCSRKKSPTRAPNRSSIPPFPRFPSLYGRRRAARPAEVLRTKPSIKPNRKGTPKACLFAFPDAFRQRRNRQGQVCRSRPHKIPHKSQGVYLTFIPLSSAVRTRGGYPEKFPWELFRYLRGTASPLEDFRQKVF